LISLTKHCPWPRWNSAGTGSDKGVKSEKVKVKKNPFPFSLLTLYTG
jgi:hypothetical protein